MGFVANFIRYTVYIESSYSL